MSTKPAPINESIRRVGAGFALGLIAALGVVALLANMLS